MNENSSDKVEQIQQSLWLRSPYRETRTLIFEYALIAAILGLNPFPSLFSLSLILLGLLSFKTIRDIGAKWGYPKGHDILANIGNFFGGLGALIMACLAWGLMIVAAIYFPIIKSFALAAAYTTFIWVAGQATNNYYAIAQPSENKVENLKAKPVGIASQLGGGGGSLKRRNILLGLLATGTILTGLYSYVKQREFNLQQAKLSNLARQSDAYVEQYLQQAFTGDTLTSQKAQAIKASVKLLPPTVPYDRPMSKLLIRCARLGTEQYLKGTIVPNYKGAISSLPSFEPSMAKYKQVTTFIGPEEATTTRKLEISSKTTDAAILQPDALRENLNQIEGVVKDVGGQVVTLKWLNPVYWGFVLQSPENSIISFRGTQQTREWFDDVLAQQIGHTNLSPFEFVGKVHRGFATIYSTLAEQVLTTARKLDKNRPIYITGHSLGASLATLAAMDLAIRAPELKENLRLYTYAGPRVGDTDFAQAHTRLVPNNYRIVNVADGIPTAPPTTAGKLVFVHPGQVWTFVDYSGDLFLGHFVSVYRKAIDAQQEQLYNQRA